MNQARQEFDYIEQIQRRSSSFVSPFTSIANGDDASVHQIPGGWELVISTDTAIQGVHWPDDFPLAKATYRAIGAAFSDLAAMGALPHWLWLSCSSSSPASLEEMWDGIASYAHDFPVELAGGDTCQSPVQSLTATVGGIVPSGKLMTRGQARVGDHVWLCGSLGLAAYGLKQWQAGNIKHASIPAFSQVCPRYAEGALMAKAGVRCCIDVSDGFVQDLSHVARQSSVSFEIQGEALYQASGLNAFLPKDDALPYILSGGEDYALLVSAAPAFDLLLAPLAVRIGHCIAQADGLIRVDGQSVDHMKGYQHFSA